MGNAVIKVESLGKCYRLGMKEEIHDTFVGAMASWMRSPLQNFKNLQKLAAFNPGDESDDILWALRDVSFEVKQGEVLGIIGHNGAGKSTLLKILSRITDPSTGSVTVDGRVASLLEVGTGFHQDLTGRENVYMNGTILGMTKKEIDRKFDEIIDFSGVEKFIDTPIKRYSSGMKVRLAFSVAAHLEPEILVIDEVLAVGDAAFQKKCLGKMQDVATQGRTVLFVSHQLEALSNLCSRAIMLEKGTIYKTGDTEEVISTYLNKQATQSTTRLRDRTDRQGDGRIRFIDSWIENDKGDRSNIFRSGELLKIVLAYEVKEGLALSNITASIAINSIKNISVTLLRNDNTGDSFEGQIPSSGRLECIVKRLPLNVGSYSYNVSVHSLGGLEDWVPHAGSFDVEPGDFFGTGRIPDRERLILMDHNWSINTNTF